jgi:hypothetical protein
MKVTFESTVFMKYQLIKSKLVYSTLLICNHDDSLLNDDSLMYLIIKMFNQSSTCGIPGYITIISVITIINIPSGTNQYIIIIIIFRFLPIFKQLRCVNKH